MWLVEHQWLSDACPWEALMIFFCTLWRLSFMVIPRNRSRKSLLIRYSVTTKYSLRFQDINAKNLPSTLLSLSLGLNPMMRLLRLRPLSLIIWQNSFKCPHLVCKAVSKTLWVGRLLGSSDADSSRVPPGLGSVSFLRGVLIGPGRWEFHNKRKVGARPICL